MSRNKVRIKGFYLLLVTALIFILYPVISNAQSCPTFKINRIEDTSGNMENGSVEIDIRSSKKYSNENFDIRQKEKQVTGALGYDVEILLSKNRLTINRLRKSQDMYLDEYVILFSDKSCKNGELIEVGTFKIK